MPRQGLPGSQGRPLARRAATTAAAVLLAAAAVAWTAAGTAQADAPSFTRRPAPAPAVKPKPTPAKPTPTKPTPRKPEPQGAQPAPRGRVTPGVPPGGKGSTPDHPAPKGS